MMKTDRIEGFSIIFEEPYFVRLELEEMPPYKAGRHKIKTKSG